MQSAVQAGIWVVFVKQAAAVAIVISRKAMNLAAGCLKDVQGRKSPRPLRAAFRSGSETAFVPFWNRAAMLT
jgi:hypothetical protein